MTLVGMAHTYFVDQCCCVSKPVIPGGSACQTEYPKGSN